MSNNKQRLARDFNEYLTQPTPTTYTTYRPTTVGTSYNASLAWVGKTNKTIFFYHWSALDKGYDKCEGLDAFLAKMKEYDIPIANWIPDFITNLGTSHVFITCRPQTKVLLCRSSYQDLQKALNMFKDEDAKKYTYR